MDIKEFSCNSFIRFDKQWALLTAGNKDDFNTMTISWGSLGTLWNKPICTVYVCPDRYTFEFMNKYDDFTVSFFDEEYKKDLLTLGTLSGRDGDKIAKTKLDVEYLDESVTFKQAKQTLVLKKLYSCPINEEDIPEDIKKRFYKEDRVHYMYIGEIKEIV